MEFAGQETPMHLYIVNVEAVIVKDNRYLMITAVWPKAISQ